MTVARCVFLATARLGRHGRSCPEEDAVARAALLAAMRAALIAWALGA